MNWTPILVSLLTVLSTGSGGLLALQNRQRLAYFMAFGAGVVIATSLLDILPEAIGLAESAHIPAHGVFLAALFGFFGFYVVERFSAIHACREVDCENDRHQAQVGVVGAAGFSLHSFLDGVAIGASFQAGAAVGIVVTLAVVAHDFADGLNTVTVLLANKANPVLAAKWLAVDALTPVAGALAASLVHFSPQLLAYLLPVFAGVFLHIGASDLLPDAHEKGSSVWTVVFTLAGALFFALAQWLVTLAGL